MHPKTPLLLEDAAEAAGHVLAFAAGRTRADYQTDPLLRSAVERQLGIVGGALARLRRVDGATAGRIADARRLVDLSDDLARHYDGIDDGRVWETVERVLPPLRTAVRGLLAEAGDGNDGSGGTR